MMEMEFRDLTGGQFARYCQRENCSDCKDRYSRCLKKALCWGGMNEVLNTPVPVYWVERFRREG